ncbi:MAG: TonB-dependent receptor [Steroidobacteraceae bacterium]
MTRSRKRKLRRSQAAWAGLPLATAILSGSPPALAQQQAETSVLEEVIVTAQKREENLQNVPLSITAISNAKLEQLHITNFDDYAQLLPSVSFQAGGPGFNRVYMRGVVNGGDGNHSGSQPSVGTYLDEQPITTIQGNLDIHIYDIARVEALAGPQGTLYGASSQSGTIRIITNKPDPSGFKAGYDLQGNSVKNGSGGGYTAEGFVNLPIGEHSAVRLVGWAGHDAGYVDNVARAIRFPSSGICLTNSPNAVLPANCSSVVTAQVSPKNAYNDVDTYGGRGALKIDLNDSWALTTTFMGQEQKANGNFAFDPSLGDLKLGHFYPETSQDRWGQAALTVEGKIGNFDLVYAGAFLKRHDVTQTDYADYALSYDAYYYAAGSDWGAYFYNDAGATINPSQYIQGNDRYQKWSHELRISSPKENRFRFVAGIFLQRQQHGIEQRYRIDDLATVSEVTGWPDTFWLTEQIRVDRDKAAFTEMNYDLTDKLTLTGGIRFFKAKNSLDGFLGFGATNPYGSCTGEAAGSTTFNCNVRFPGVTPCDYSVHINGGPCKNLTRLVDESGNTPKVSLSYKVSDDKMLYATWSKGFRPGGVNRRNTLPPYKADYLTNSEIGWKTTWNGGRFRLNGALFWEDWKDFQFAFLGQNSLTVIVNAGNARIKGAEAEFEWAATSGLTLSGGFTVLDAKSTSNYCEDLDANGLPVTNCADPQAPSGSQLPVTPKFKGDLVGRYKFNLGNFDAHFQGSLAYVGARLPDLRFAENAILGELEAYTLADFTFGIENKSYSLELYVHNAFDKRANLDRYAQCDAITCFSNQYLNVGQPRTIGVQFGQQF